MNATRDMVAFAALFFSTACGPKAGDSLQELKIVDGRIVATIEGSMDSVFAGASRVMVQEHIDMFIYLPDQGLMETTYFDLSNYSIFDPEIWDATERLVKLRFYATSDGPTTTLVCEPLYNPNEVFTGETEYGRLRVVPPQHPGSQIAELLTRRIAAHVEGVSAP